MANYLLSLHKNPFPFARFVSPPPATLSKHPLSSSTCRPGVMDTRLAHGYPRAVPCDHQKEGLVISHPSCNAKHFLFTKNSVKCRHARSILTSKSKARRGVSRKVADRLLQKAWKAFRKPGCSTCKAPIWRDEARVEQLNEVIITKAVHCQNATKAFCLDRRLNCSKWKDGLQFRKPWIQAGRCKHQWRVAACKGASEVSKETSNMRIADGVGESDVEESRGSSSERLWEIEDETKEIPFLKLRHIGFSAGRRLLLGATLSALIPSLWPTSGEAMAGDKVASESGKEGSSSVFGSIEKGKGSRVYDATVLGEPVPLGSDKGRVWQKLLAARVIYLGEAEHVPDPEDKLLELEVLRTLRDKCFEQRRPVTLALEAFPCTLQTELNKYMSKRLTDNELKALVTNWPTGRWQEYEPILHYCRDGGVRIMACGAPPEILLAVQAKGVQGLSDAEKRKYIPPIDGFGGNSFQLIQRLALTNLLPMVSFSFEAGPYQFAQARIVSDYVMAQVVTQAMTEGGAVGSLVVITGASHVKYGSRGAGLPARISKKLQKKTQIVVLLNPERQRIRKEGELPEADFLWYSAAKPCVRNCFDRAEVARVMGAAGQRRDALPQDIQAGLERGIVSPEVLKNFIDLDRQPLLAELTRRFQGLRERWLADPRFLQRLAIEEAISITTTLMAQYERRKDRFWKEIDYVITDTVRGSVVDFFTVWLPAPRLAFRPLDTESTVQGALEGLKGLLGSFPDNAFQRAQVGEHWDLTARIGAVVLGGGKLFFVGFISSLGTLSITNTLLFLRQYFNPQLASKPNNKRSPILKTAFVYAAFLGTSANLRYQAIAGLVEHWVADYFLASEPLAGNLISFVARTANSYWGTTQWVDLARITGLQAHQSEPSETVLQDQSKDSESKTHSDPVDLNSSWKSAASMGDVEKGSVESQVHKKGTIEKSGVEGEKL